MDIRLVEREPDQALDQVGTGRALAPLDADTLRLTDAYWRAANYLSVGQLYLYDNPLLREPLTLDHVSVTTPSLAVTPIWAAVMLGSQRNSARTAS